MTTIQDMFQQAQLAEAAYSNFSGINISTPTQVIKDALTTGGGKFSAVQADEFTKNWRVVDQFTDNGLYGLTDGSGFSATLFQRLDANQQPTGQYTFAARGSTSFTDFAIDLFDLPMGGVGYFQVESMVNYVLRLQAGSAGVTQQVELINGVPTLSSTYVRGVGPGITPSQLTITGHSLGGFLSQIYERIFGSTGFYTYNAVGVLRPNAPILEQLTNLLGLPPGNFNSGTGENLLVSLEPAQLIGTIQGNPQITVFSETQNTALAHMMGYLTDSLAVYNLFASIDPGLTPSSITGILKASSNTASNSLESAVSGLGKLFNVPSAIVTGSAFDSNRDLLYTSLNSIQGNVHACYTITALDSMDTATLAANAKGDIAYRYALKELNPFAVTGADYSRFNTNGSLDVRDPATGKGELSESWLQDRAAMLGALIARNIQDADAAPYPVDSIYSDVARGITLRPANSGHVTDDMQKQIRFGSDASDGRLNGGMQADRLYGMGGNDSVNGEAGNDYLEGGRNDDKLNGGTGNDTYVYLKGDGKDTITDTDGLNSIVIGNTTLTGTSEKSILAPKNTREWTVNGGEYVYRFDPNLHTLNISGTALGSGDANSITLKDITDLAQLKSRYGIDLALPAQVALTESAINPFTSYAESIAATVNAIGNIIENGAKRINLAFNQLLSATDRITIVIDSIVGMGKELLKLVTGDQVLGFDTGSITLNATEGQNFISLALLEQGDLSANASATFKAIIERTDANGVVTTIDSNLFTLNISDSVAVNALTGDNAWTLATTYGNGLTYKDQFGHLITDPTQLGTMASVVNGSFDNDIICGDAAITTVQAIANGNTDTATGNKGDWLAGRSGKDVLIAGAGNDVLSGGGGDDLLIAGAGEDIILGDADYVAQQTDWSVIHEPNGCLLQPAYGTVDPADSGNDTIYAGAGNDHVWSGIGDDTVLGEGGDDSLNGDGGNDFIDGGDGHDSVQGGEGSDTLYGGAGDDILSADDNGQLVAGSNYLNGENGNDTLYGGKGDDTMLGGADTDILWGNDGNDLMDAGDGTDTLWGGNGNDTVKGGTGDDKLYGEAGANYLDGGDGADTLNSGGPDSALYGGAGNDDISAAGGGNTLDGGADDDTLATSGDDNYLDGGEGTNSLQSTGNYNALFAGTGNDDLAAWGDGNYLDAGNGNNTLYAQGMGNELYAGSGNDNLQATGGNNTLDGGAGNNTLVADSGGNTLIAGAGDDTLSSTGGGSYLDGGDGANTRIADGGYNELYAGSGNDTLSAAGGNNYLDGGDVMDIYVFDAGAGTKHIADSGIASSGSGQEVGNEVRFNFSFADSGLAVGLGSLKLGFANGDELHIDNYDPNDPTGTCSISTFVFDHTSLRIQTANDPILLAA